MTDIAAFSGVGMEPGTLYGALSRLERRGWIRPLAAGERRRPYEITAAGQEVLAEQLRSMQQIALHRGLRRWQCAGGRHRHLPRRTLPAETSSKASYDTTAAARLWQASAGLTATA